MGIVGGVMVGDARQPGMHVGAAEIFRAHHLAGRGLHQRRAAEEIVPWRRTITLSSDIAGT